MLERSRMSSTERATMDRMIKAGQAVTQGVIPDLDPISADYAELWSDLRASTPADQPISLQSMKLMLGSRREMLHVLPEMRLMDQTMFGWVNNRREMERKKAEQKAKADRQRSKRR